MLSFLLLAMQTHPPEVLYPHLSRIIEDVMACVSEDWYKVITEALRCVGGIIRIVRPISQNGEPAFRECCFNYAPYVTQLYEGILPRLKAYDIDQTIKECAIGSSYYRYYFVSEYIIIHSNALSFFPLILTFCLSHSFILLFCRIHGSLSGPHG